MHSHRPAEAVAERPWPPRRCDQAANGSPHSQRPPRRGLPDKRPWQHMPLLGRAHPCGEWLPCPAARAAAVAGGLTSPATTRLTKRRRLSSAMSSSPRAKARVRAIASRGRLSPAAPASNNPSARLAQSAQTATIRRSALSVCERTLGCSHAGVLRQQQSESASIDGEAPAPRQLQGAPRRLAARGRDGRPGVSRSHECRGGATGSCRSDSQTRKFRKRVCRSPCRSDPQSAVSGEDGHVPMPSASRLSNLPANAGWTFCHGVGPTHL
jgi:hypothetical protein